jgi:DNA-binding response OmpR family regulator
MTSPRVLIVEDDPFTSDLLVEALALHDFQCTCVPDGARAWALLADEAFVCDGVLLDRGLPDLDGLEILRRRRELPEARQVPFVLQTSRSSTADIEEGLQAGAYYYLVKPFSSDTLVAILTAAVRDHRHQERLRGQLQHASKAMHLLRTGRFRFQSLEEAYDIAALVAKATPRPEHVVLGLSELMTNAVEHGNLGIGYAEKSALLEAGTWSEEIARRLQAPGGSERWATLAFRRTEAGFRFRIRDQGLGFDWRRYLELSPERAFDLHGRGIAISAGTCFDRLDFLGTGSEVEAFVAAGAPEPAGPPEA